MEKLTFAKLLRIARFLKRHGFQKSDRQLALGYFITGAKYYYVEQG